MYRTATKLQNAVNAVNRRYHAGLNDDDQVFRMVKIDEQTKGFSFRPLYDSYEVCTDYERFSEICEKYGYWSKQVQEFNERLKLKGGYEYMAELNGRYKHENKC